MNNVILVVYNILFYFSFVLIAYYLILGIIGAFGRSQKYKMVEDRQKFCIFVPCHNEETVIGATVENFAKFTYSKELFDIYFIADNCKDNTANAIRKVIAKNNLHNFHVLERNINDPYQRGKPHALNWGINQLEKTNSFYEKYDMFMIIDADNFADANILEHINSQYYSYKEKNRPVMIQTYLDSKNKNNLVARGYFVSYRISNGFMQLPKHRLGLNPVIGGTGFTVSTKFLKEIGGYNCRSLTEDLEIQTLATLNGKRIAYNGNVRIYDEKPTGVKQAIVQKTRWAQGFWFLAFKYVGRLFVSLFNFKQIRHFFRKLDNIIHLLGMSNYINIFAMLLFNIYFTIADITPTTNPIVSGIFFVAGIFAYVQILLASLYDGSPKEKKRALLELIPNIVAITIYAWTFVYSALIGLFKCRNQRVWKKTVHKITTMENESQPQKLKAKSPRSKPKTKQTKVSPAMLLDDESHETI